MENEKDKEIFIRPPVAVILGHVDHGKTTLLDYIRKSHVAEKETGGITQHIGAYEIEYPIGKKITFIDTPGHEAFSAMRLRGVKAADIAILVVSADEGVQQQTKEAVSHIKKMNIPYLVAINKIDRPTANPEKVKRDLAVMDVIVESMGGKIPSIEISAVTGKGVDNLLEMIVLMAEMENLKTNLAAPASGVVIESFLDSKRGPVATIILKSGVLKKGDVLATASAFGKIKGLENFLGAQVEKGLPSMPLVVMGFEEPPMVGESISVFENTESAKEKLAKREKFIFIGKENLKSEDGHGKYLNLVLKCDFRGSIEAILEVLNDLSEEISKSQTLSKEKVGLNILKAEVGEINESDVRSAKNSQAFVIGFRVKTNKAIIDLAEREKVRILNFEIIYELVQAIRSAIEKKLEPETVRTEIGKLKILGIFYVERNRQTVGGKVTDGKVEKGVAFEILRGQEKIGKGKVINLQKNKKEVDEVLKGSECGMLCEADNKIEEGDILAFFSEERRKGKLDK